MTSMHGRIVKIGKQRPTFTVGSVNQHTTITPISNTTNIKNGGTGIYDFDGFSIYNKVTSVR